MNNLTPQPKIDPIVKPDLIEEMHRLNLIDGIFIVHDLASDAEAYLLCLSDDIGKRLEDRLHSNALKAIGLVDLYKMGTTNHIMIAQQIQTLISAVFNLLEDEVATIRQLKKLSNLLENCNYKIKDY